MNAESLATSLAALHAAARPQMNLGADAQITLHLSFDPAMAEPVFAWLTGNGAELGAALLSDRWVLQEAVASLVASQQAKITEPVPAGGGLMIAHEVLPRMSVAFGADGAWSDLAA
ncbi:hypothetical protein LG293_15845 (plasmid) [Citricoccus nitrophenolicus]